MKKIKITTKSELEGFSGHFKTVEVDNLEELTMENCRNVAALACAKKTFEDEEAHSWGMWHTEIVEQ